MTPKQLKPVGAAPPQGPRQGKREEAPGEGPFDRSKAWGAEEEAGAVVAAASAEGL